VFDEEALELTKRSDLRNRIRAEGDCSDKRGRYGSRSKPKGCDCLVHSV